MYNLKRWRRLRLRILDAFGWRCTKCGRAGRLEVHHVRPIRQGGSRWDADNLETRCFECHRAEHQPIPPDVREWMELEPCA